MSREFDGAWASAMKEMWWSTGGLHRGTAAMHWDHGCNGNRTFCRRAKAHKARSEAFCDILRIAAAENTPDQPPPSSSGRDPRGRFLPNPPFPFGGVRLPDLIDGMVETLRNGARRVFLDSTRARRGIGWNESEGYRITYETLDHIRNTAWELTWFPVDFDVLSELEAQYSTHWERPNCDPAYCDLEVNMADNQIDDIINSLVLHNEKWAEQSARDWLGELLQRALGLEWHIRRIPCRFPAEVVEQDKFHAEMLQIERSLAPFGDLALRMRVKMRQLTRDLVNRASPEPTSCTEAGWSQLNKHAMTQVFRDELEQAVKDSCTCGGAHPEMACAACRVWNQMSWVHERYKP